MKTEQEIRDDVARLVDERLASGDEFAEEFAAKAVEFLDDLADRYEAATWDAPRMGYGGRSAAPYVTAWFPALGSWRLAQEGVREGIGIQYEPVVRPTADLVEQQTLPIIVGGSWPTEDHDEVIYITQDQHPGDVQFWPDWKGLNP